MSHPRAFAPFSNALVTDASADFRRPPDFTIDPPFNKQYHPSRREKLRAIGISLQEHAEWRHLRQNLLPADRPVTRRGVVAPPPSPPSTASDVESPLLGAARGDAA
ncbi:hypothetical protein LEL_06235 [Akanthomyces lecanii RCEF 1005]|uniref:Uncharacterized protein n=1 Tax=Akanthomyces lecanii RCEF 1005 TaxID=1081108 RepID=A0A168GJ35_CORDF|nr:hypothetical protein LEL_06235 [Akanthomyces lecanii RCEF 1005]